MINLATRPFRNERLPAVAVLTAGVCAVLLTVVHGVAASRIVRSGGEQQEVRRVEEEIARLRDEASKTAVAAPDAATVLRWAILKDLVDRRMFSWTRLFQQLETTLPRQVRLLSLTPKIARGNVQIGMVAIARPPSFGLELIRVLESRGPFAKVYPLSSTERDSGEAQFTYELRYRQPAIMVDAAAAEPAAQDPAADPSLQEVPPDEMPPDEMPEDIPMDDPAAGAGAGAGAE